MRRGSSREEVIPRKRNARAAAAVSKGVATSIVGRRGSSFAQEVDGSLDPIEVTAELANGSEVRVRFKFTSIDDWDDVNAELRNSKRHKASQSQDEEERTHSPLIIRISVPRFERDGQSLKLAIVDEDVDAIPVLEIVPASESPESAEQEDVQFASDTDEESQPSKRGGKNAVVKEEEFGSEDDFETEQFPKSSRMTARQRSRLEGFEVEHLSLPSKKQGKDGKAAKEEDELPGDPDDEEAVLRKSEVARKRRLVAQKQDEEEKRDVIERLLNKANAKTDKAKRIKEIKKELKSEQKTTEVFANSTRYTMKLVPQDQETKLICMVAFPVNSSVAQSLFDSQLPQKKVTDQCWRDGCKNPKKYRCPNTKRPYCSVSCFKLINSSISSSLG